MVRGTGGPRDTDTRRAADRNTGYIEGTAPVPGRSLWNPSLWAAREARPDLFGSRFVATSTQVRV